MGSSAILILSSSAAALQTRCFPSPAVVESHTEGGRAYHQAVVRLLKTSEGGGSTRGRRSSAARAGLGRYSGAVHGNSKRKSRSRRRQQDDGHEERADEHQENITGSEDNRATQTSEQSSESTAEEDAACEAFAAAEGIIDEDGDLDDGSQQLSYNRYLLELGVTPRSLQGDTQSKLDSRESLLRRLDRVQDEIQGHLAENSQVGIEAGGQGGDLDHEGTKELNTEGAIDAKTGRGKLAKKLDLVLQNEIEPKNDSVSDLTPTSPPLNEGADKLFGTVGQSTDMAPETDEGMEPPSVSDGGASKKKRRKKLKPKAAVDSALEIEGGDTERVRASSGEAERPAVHSDKEPGELPSVNGHSTVFKEAENFEQNVDFGDHVTVVKEAENFEEKVDFGGHVTVFKEAEIFEQKADFGATEAPKEEAGTNSSAAEIVEQKVDFGAAEAPKEEAGINSSAAAYPVTESAERNGQSPVALDSVVDSHSTNDTSNGDRSPDTPNVEDSPLTVLSTAGAAIISGPSLAADEPEGLILSRIESVVGDQSAQVGSQVVETVLEQAVKVVPLTIVEQTVETVAQVASKVVEFPVVVVEQAAQVGGQMVDILPDVVTEQVGQVVDQVSDFAEQVGQVVDVVSDVAEQMANTVNEQVEQVAESVSSTASQVAEHVTSGVDTVTTTASAVVDQVTEFFSSDEEYESDSDDEFEAYITSDLPQFRGREGLNNFIVRQEDQGVLSKIYDLYTYMLKQSFPKFAAAMFCTPILVSAVFTLLYLPEFKGLAFDETARDFFEAAGGESLTLTLSGKTIFQVFMFSLSLSTGLQPELAPLSPYTLVVANLNALVAQLVFVFLSGAVFARLSQPSQPLRCSSVALVSASPAQRRRKENALKVFMARYVLAGPQPCELVDVKVDLTYKYNTLTRTGSFFRATQSLKLVRPEIAFLTHGMLVRHVIDETSPLYQRTPEMLNKEDAVFCLSVVGLERASMQSVFHVQHYCVVDNDVVWDAEFEDIILINKRNRRVVDHSRLSMWRPVPQ